MYRRKIIILGGNGFIGTKLSNFYSKKKINTVSIGRSSRSKNIYSKSNKYLKNIKINFFNIKKLENYIDAKSIVIFSGLNGKIQNKEFKKNFEDLILFLNSKKIKRFLLLSSVSVYGNRKLKNYENSLTKPINNYAKNCLTAEKILKKSFYHKKNFIILRIANVFGENRVNLSVIEKIIYNNIINNKYNFYKQNIIRSYVSINDLVKIIFMLSSKKIVQNIYNISNPNYQYSFKKLIDIFQQNFSFYQNYLYNSEIPIIHNSIIDTTKIENIFKFQDNFIKEITSVVNFYKKK